MFKKVPIYDLKDDIVGFKYVIFYKYYFQRMKYFFNGVKHEEMK